MLLLEGESLMKKRFTSYMILFFFIILFSIGICAGDLDIVLDRAISICLECIGVG